MTDGNLQLLNLIQDYMGVVYVSVTKLHKIRPVRRPGRPCKVLCVQWLASQRRTPAAARASAHRPCRLKVVKTARLIHQQWTSTVVTWSATNSCSNLPLHGRRSAGTTSV